MRKAKAMLSLLGFTSFLILTKLCSINSFYPIIQTLAATRRIIEGFFESNLVKTSKERLSFHGVNSQVGQNNIVKQRPGMCTIRTKVKMENN